MIEKIIESEMTRYRESYAPIVREVNEDIELAGYIDHTLLKADATPEMIVRLCQEAREFNFWSVCVNTGYLSLVSKALEGSPVKKTVVVGFPLGQMATMTKGAETVWALENGADEFDMVINVGLLKAREYQKVYEDISEVVESAEGKIVKVILENCLLTEEEKVAACAISREAGAAFVKTSTGFSTGGATIEDVSLMKFVVGDRCRVKASGGVRTREDTIAMIRAGADRIGTSSGIKIVTGGIARDKGGY